MTTIREVADRAGVSIATVSHVLNDTRFVSDDLRSRVQQAMRDLGYQPNRLARSLRSGKSHTVGLVLPDSSNPYFAEVARSVQSTAFELGYSVLLCNTDGELDKEALYGALLIEKQVDGVILIAAGASGQHMRDLQQRGIPLAVVDRASPDAFVDSVQIDNRAGGRLAAQHLVDLGHRRIACIGGPPEVYPSYDRVYGYLDARRAADLPDDADTVINANFRPDGGYAATRHLLSLPEPPTAIFACNDLMAMGAIGAIVECGLRCPQDVSVVGFDDMHLARYTNPPLTTVAQPKVEMGRQAMLLLLERMNAPVLPIRSLLLEAMLVVRSSTQPLPIPALHCSERG
jgi:LacI family transcriptional regulator